MAYINTKTNQYPVSEQDIRNEFPNTSFPTPFQAPEGYAPVLNSPTPEVPNPVLQFAREITPTQDSLGNWMTTYEVVDMYSDYTDSEGVVHTKEEQEIAAVARDEDNKKTRNKDLAERLLKETDWTEGLSVRDVTKTPHLLNGDEIDDYRVSLRSIAVNPPVTVEEWPVRPNNQWSS